MPVGPDNLPLSADPAMERSEEWLIGPYAVGLTARIDDNGDLVVHIDGDLINGDLPPVWVYVNGERVSS